MKLKLNKNVCITGLVAATLILCVMCTHACVLHYKINEARNSASEAEELVDMYAAEVTELREANTQLQETNAEMQATNDTLTNALAVYDYDFNIAAPQPPRYIDVPVDEDLQDYIWSLCCLYDIEDQYVLVYAVMRKESNFDSNAISATNDYGLMQINISNHSSLSQRLGITDFLDPYQNVHAGIYMLANALHKYGNVPDALMAYNMGGGGASKLWAQGIHSTSYSETVLDYYNQFS